MDSVKPPDTPRQRKLADHLAYPPRGMRLERAAAYVDLSQSKFLELVEEGIMPKPKRWDGCVVWDRVELDAVFEGGSDEGRPNTIHRLLGMSGKKT
jgi:predicted DNA-binding transcriptional regulator AlpA